jgi:hypothetical protein
MSKQEHPKCGANGQKQRAMRQTRQIRLRLILYGNAAHTS